MTIAKRRPTLPWKDPGGDEPVFVLQLGNDGELARVYDKIQSILYKSGLHGLSDRTIIGRRWFMMAWFINFIIIFNLPDDTTDFLSLLFSLALSWTAAVCDACSAACCWLNNWLSDTITEFRMFRFIASKINHKKPVKMDEKPVKMDEKKAKFCRMGESFCFFLWLICENEVK